MTTYRPSQNLHPLSLLAQVSSRQTSGCLKVEAGEMTWLFHLEQGKLKYATTSTKAFERLDNHLRRLSLQVPALVSAVRVQVRLLFEQTDADDTLTSPDYQAICWLVEQRHLHPNQAVTLIEGLAQEVLEEFLLLREGRYELLESDYLDELPLYCQLNLRPLVEVCYNRTKQRQATVQSSPSAATVPSRNGGYRAPEYLARQTQVAVQTTPVTEASKADSPPTPAPTKTTYTIACIDDSPTVLNAINSFLDDKIFSVLMISDPVKALMQVIRNKPDLILLDVTMPNLDGYELCSLLRRHPDFKNTPIIMVTSNTGFIDRAKAKLVRASGYLTKPFGQSDLLKMIFKHLN